MSEDTGQDPTAPPDDEPILALRTLEQETSFFFLRGIRGRIHRQTTASQLLSVSWQLPGIVLSELTRMLVHIVGGRNRKREE